MTGQHAHIHKTCIGGATRYPDTVAYSQSFIDSQNRYPTNIPKAQDKVKALHYVRNLTLAEIEWDRPALPKRVNVKYLKKKMNITTME
jgi:hypothetical protein